MSESPITDRAVEKAKLIAGLSAWVRTNDMRELEALCGNLAEALLGCAMRLQACLAELNGNPIPQFDPPAPSALENIKAVATALAEFDRASRSSQ